MTALLRTVLCKPDNYCYKTAQLSLMKFPALAFLCAIFALLAYPARAAEESTAAPVTASFIDKQPAKPPMKFIRASLILHNRAAREVAPLRDALGPADRRARWRATGQPELRCHPHGNARRFPQGADHGIGAKDRRLVGRGV